MDSSKIAASGASRLAEILPAKVNKAAAPMQKSSDLDSKASFATPSIFCTLLCRRGALKCFYLFSLRHARFFKKRLKWLVENGWL
jgi:hypothetical protein